MKLPLLSLLALTLSFTAHAAPDCWTADGNATGPNKEGREITDGGFLISVDAKNISKDDLLLVMTKVNFGNLKADSFPQFLEDVMIVSTKASVAGTEEGNVDRPK
ncbi:MAG: hypothetical protein EOP11_10620, partial [Proteobacteria bacterium]